jgi:hypothetical protein
MLELLLLTLFILSLVPVTFGATDSPKPPPRGWRSWNLFGLHVNQTLMIEVMDAMVLRNRSVDGVPTSLFDLGYLDVGLGESYNNLSLESTE